MGGSEEVAVRVEEKKREGGGGTGVGEMGGEEGEMREWEMGDGKWEKSGMGGKGRVQRGVGRWKRRL